MEKLDATPWPDDSTAMPLGAQRHALTLHAADARTVYSARNWIERDASLPVRGFD